MSYTIQEIPGEEKPFKVLDESGKQVAESTERRKAEKYIAFKTMNEK